MRTRLTLLTVILLTIAASANPLEAQTTQNPVTGQDAFANWSQEKPGVLRKISITDLPKPDSAQSIRNQPHIVPPPGTHGLSLPPGLR
jgi:hypothetical protein